MWPESHYWEQGATVGEILSTRDDYSESTDGKIEARKD